MSTTGRVSLPVMPDFSRPTRGTRQTVAAALRSLRAVGVEGNRVRIERIGGGWPANTVVTQEPAPGTALRPNTPVVLRISAPALINAVPFAMRDHRASAIGVDRLMALLDAPIARLHAYVAEAGGFLELRHDVPETGWRWVSDLFQHAPGELPAELVHALAKFMPALAHVAGTERGVAMGLHVLFGLPLGSLVLQPGVAPMADDRQTRLGVSNGRLGFDAVIGTGVTMRTHAVVTIGPVSLTTFLREDVPTRQRYRQVLYRLVMPSGVREVTERWDVAPPTGGARVGVGDEPARLGLNARLSQ